MGGREGGRFEANVADSEGAPQTTVLLINLGMSNWTVDPLPNSELWEGEREGGKEGEMEGGRSGREGGRE